MENEQNKQSISLAVRLETADWIEVEGRRRGDELCAAGAAPFVGPLSVVLSRKLAERLRELAAQKYLEGASEQEPSDE